MNEFPVRPWRAIAVVASLCGWLCGCSSGSGNDTSLPSITFPISAITFSVTGPDDPTPASQTFAGEFSVKAVYMAALTEGPAVERVTYLLSGESATISVYPKSPAELGAGLHRSRIVIFGQACADTVCSRLASGPAYLIDVQYLVPQTVTTVSPYVAQENASGDVIVRGSGFSKFEISGVSFGGFPAPEFSVTSDTQIEARYPALGPGRYEVRLQAEGAPAPVRSDAELVVVSSPALTAATLPYPTPNPGITGILYDAERSALLATTALNGGELLRFRHAGNSWSAGESLPLNTLHGIAIAANGKSILGIIDDSIVTIDADTLAVGSSLSAPLDGGTTLSGIAVANDARALVTTTNGENAASPIYLVDFRSRIFSSSEAGLHALPHAAGNGALILVSQQDTTAATTPSLYEFSALTGTFSTAASVNRNAILPVVDRLGSRIAVNGAAVYDSSYNLLGSLPSTTLAVAFSPDGTRLYAYDAAAASVLVYDTVTPAMADGMLHVLGTPLMIAGDPGDHPQIAISAQGDALFLAGLDHISVIPVSQQ